MRLANTNCADGAGSDVFGSDICTCRPYLIHGIEECVKTAIQGGTGLIVYYRKEGRALGKGGSGLQFTYLTSNHHSFVYNIPHLSTIMCSM